MKRNNCLAKKIGLIRRKISANKEIINIFLTILITFIMSLLRNFLSLAKNCDFNIKGESLLSYYSLSNIVFYRDLIKDFLLIIITWNFSGIFRILCKGDNKTHSSFLTLFLFFCFLFNVIWFVVEILFDAQYWLLILGLVLFLSATFLSCLYFRNRDVNDLKTADNVIAPIKK